MQLYIFGYCCVLQELDMQNVPISLEEIRENIAMFILSEIVDQNGKFHDPTN
jgi:hypothetical protein